MATVKFLGVSDKWTDPDNWNPALPVNDDDVIIDTKNFKKKRLLTAPLEIPKNLTSLNGLTVTNYKNNILTANGVTLTLQSLVLNSNYVIGGEGAEGLRIRGRIVLNNSKPLADAFEAFNLFLAAKLMAGFQCDNAYISGENFGTLEIAPNSRYVFAPANKTIIGCELFVGHHAGLSILGAEKQKLYIRENITFDKPLATLAISSDVNMPEGKAGVAHDPAAPATLDFAGTPSVPNTLRFFPGSGGNTNVSLPWNLKGEGGRIRVEAPLTVTLPHSCKVEDVQLSVAKRAELIFPNTNEDRVFEGSTVVRGGGTVSIECVQSPVEVIGGTLEVHSATLLDLNGGIMVFQGPDARLTNFGAITMERLAKMIPSKIKAPGAFVILNLGLITVEPYQNKGTKVLQNSSVKIMVPALSIGSPFPPYLGGMVRVLKDQKLKAPNLIAFNLAVQGKLDTDGFVNISTGGNLSAQGSPTASGDILNSAGTVSPGGASSVSQFSLVGTSGTYSQKGAASLKINFAGTTPGTGYDQLSVSGLATLNGTLHLNLLGGYAPNVNDTFQILTCGSCMGTFASITGQVFASSSKRFDIQYNAMNLTLTCVSNATPPGTPTVTGLSSNSGSTEGGGSITVSGSNFDGISAVLFGTTPANNWIRNSSTSITAVVPAHASGTVDVTVSNVTGTSATSSSDAYTYTTSSAPTVTGVSPTIGDPAGDSTYVTIAGSNLAGTTGVKFGTINADWFVVQSSGQVLTLAPASGAGTVDVTVTTYAGTSSTSSADLFTYPNLPSVSSLSTSTGSTAGGTVLNIAGSGFTGTQSVYFGGSIVTDLTVNSDTSITVLVPPSDAGTIDVLVQGPNGISLPSSSTRFTFNAASAPSISSLSVSSGGTGGGTVVTISGSNFTGATQVLFGQLVAQAFVNSDTQITAVAPPQAGGTVDVTVVTPTGVSAVSSSDQFTYTAGSAPTVTSLSVSSGSTGGGTVLAITGTGFTDATSVLFGTVAASFSSLNDSTIIASAPAHGSGTVDVTVINNAGTSSTSSADQFTYSSASSPSISSVTPTSGPATGGTAVTIVGSNFTGASSVTFGGIDATVFEILSDNIIQAYAAGGSGTVHTIVTTPSGSSSAGSADQFTYTGVSAPSVSSLSTSSGSTAGGDLLLIGGSGFATAAKVEFGSMSTSDFVLNSDNQITVATPASAAGTYDVQVVNAAGSSAPSSADRFTYNLGTAPAISSLSTSSGTTAGGISVTIGGTHFTSATQVLFGAVPTSSFTVNSDSSITATSPPQAAGTVDVRVVTPNGTSAAVSADHFTYSVGSSPSVSSLGTTSGSSGGGTRVAVQGSGFTGAQGVLFGSIPASSFTVLSDSAVVATSPAQVAGTVDVIVTIFGASSSTTSADHFTYTAASAPSISTLTPGSGPVTAGQVVLLTGSYFSGASQVTFGGVPASFQVNSDSSITAYSPFLPAGSYVVRVTTPSGMSSPSGPSYTYSNVGAPAPAVTGVAPNTGATAGGRTVTVTGTNFSGATAVKFGGTNSSYQIISDTQIIATSPAHAAGTVHIQVTTSNGTSGPTGADQFTYVTAGAPTVTGLSPSGGSTAGGTSVSLTGTNFTGATSVLFGTVPALSFTVNSATSIAATSPPQYSGSINVTVTTSAGTSATGGGNVFTYTTASLPTVTSLGTTTGTTAGGTSVALTGTNFTGAMGVTFGGVAATSFTVNSPASITATSPAQSAGTVDVQVTSYSGTSAPSVQFSYTVASVPTVSALSTHTGTTAGGTSVTITGTNFIGATGVTFGTVPATSFSVVSSTSISAVSPPHMAGTVDVIVQSYAGTSPTSSSDQFAYSAASPPAVSSLGTGSGSSGGGTSVAINGSNFGGATGVTFGGVPAAGFTVNSNSSITATSPAHTPGVVDVQVTTYSGTSSPSAGDQFTYTAAPAPSISGLAPNSGSMIGGDTITVLGSYFTGATAVTFGGTSASYAVLSDNVILATSPAMVPGTVNIQVMTPTGASSPTGASQYTYSSVSLPGVGGLSTSSGSTAGGTALTISGSGFTNTSSVMFGDVAAASYLVVNDTNIQAVSPSQAAGALNVSVTANGMTSAPSGADRFTYTAASSPSVTGLGTTSGSSAGGTSVAISGNGFTGGTRVTFGGVDAASFVVNSDSSITAVSPPLAAGTVDVVVTTPTGTSAVSSSDQFTYTTGTAPTVSALSLNSGTTAGGTVVTVMGSNLTGVTGVNFGAVAASYAFVNDGQITATAPPQAAGTVHVTVVTTSGTSSTSSADQFSYGAASGPVVSAVSPTGGSIVGGAQVIVVGSRFTAASAVNFGTTAANSFTVLSDNAIQAYAPAQAAGTVDITVTTPSGTSSTSSADQFTYTTDSTPTVSSLNTTSGATAGGNAVIVAGTNFTDVSDVEFGVYSVSTYYVNSATQITAVVPSQAAGTVDVTVTNPGGTSSTSGSDQYTFTSGSAPTVTAVSPSSGPVAGGNYVTVTGTGFLGVYEVDFGANAAPTFVVLSSTTLVATAPAAASSGSVDIRVKSYDGTSSIGSGDVYTYV